MISKLLNLQPTKEELKRLVVPNIVGEIIQANNKNIPY